MIDRKRQEIRDILEAWRDDRCLFLENACPYQQLGGVYCSAEDEAFDCLMKRLDSQDVVMLVKGELPETSDEEIQGKLFDDGWILSPSRKTILTSSIQSIIQAYQAKLDAGYSQYARLVERED